MLLCAISDGAAPFALPERAAAWAGGGVDFIQVREKELAGAELLRLTAKVVEAVRRTGAATSVLLNGPVEVALAAGADGVHLPGALRGSVKEVRTHSPHALVSVACHSAEEVADAGGLGVSIAVFAPVFEKRVLGGEIKGPGLEGLAKACAAADGMPVLALGGITASNARSCLGAGAAGVAGIRLFAGDQWRGLV